VLNSPIRVLRLVMPMAFVVENVNGMAYGASRRLLENQLCRYRLAGYKTAWRVLNAKDYGVAQHRRRLFLVGIRSDINFRYEFPEPTHGPGLRKHVTQWDVLSEMPTWPMRTVGTKNLSCCPNRVYLPDCIPDMDSSQRAIPLAENSRTLRYRRTQSKDEECCRDRSDTQYPRCR